MIVARKEVFRITQRKDGAIFKTQKLCDSWLPIIPRTPAEETRIAREHGGDILVSTTDWKEGQPTGKATA